MEWPVCPRCGSDNVTADAVASWSKGGECWEIGEVLPSGFCVECQGNIDIEWKNDDPLICGACNGSGEGMHDGAICSECRGKGEVLPEGGDEW